MRAQHQLSLAALGILLGLFVAPEGYPAAHAQAELPCVIAGELSGSYTIEAIDNTGAVLASTGSSDGAWRIQLVPPAGDNTIYFKVNGELQGDWVHCNSGMPVIAKLKPPGTPIWKPSSAARCDIRLTQAEQNFGTVDAAAAPYRAELAENPRRPLTQLLTGSLLYELLDCARRYPDHGKPTASPSAPAPVAPLTVPPVGPPADANTPPTTAAFSVDIETCRNVYGTAAAALDAMRRAQGTSVAVATQAESCARGLAADPTGGTVPEAEAARPKTDVPSVATGKLRVIRPFGDGKEQPAAAGAPLQAGDTISAGNETGTIELPGGSMIALDRDATVRVLDAAGTSIEQPRGRVFYSIVDRRMTIRVPAASGEWVVTNRGTKFAVSIENGVGRVEVVEGSVSVTAGGRTVDVHSGKTASIPVGGTPVLAGFSMPSWLFPAAGGALFVVVLGGVFMLGRRSASRRA